MPRTKQQRPRHILGSLTDATPEEAQMTPMTCSDENETGSMSSPEEVISDSNVFNSESGTTLFLPPPPPLRRDEIAREIERRIRGDKLQTIPNQVTTGNDQTPNEPVSVDGENQVSLGSSPTNSDLVGPEFSCSISSKSPMSTKPEEELFHSSFPNNMYLEYLRKFVPETVQKQERNGMPKQDDASDFNFNLADKNITEQSGFKDCLGKISNDPQFRTMWQNIMFNPVKLMIEMIMQSRKQISQGGEEESTVEKNGADPNNILKKSVDKTECDELFNQGSRARETKPKDDDSQDQTEEVADAPTTDKDEICKNKDQSTHSQSDGKTTTAYVTKENNLANHAQCKIEQSNKFGSSPYSFQEEKHPIRKEKDGRRENNGNHSQIIDVESGYSPSESFSFVRTNKSKSKHFPHDYPRPYLPFPVLGAPLVQSNLLGSELRKGNGYDKLEGGTESPTIKSGHITGSELSSREISSRSPQSQDSKYIVGKADSNSRYTPYDSYERKMNFYKTPPASHSQSSSMWSMAHHPFIGAHPYHRNPFGRSISPKNRIHSQTKPAYPSFSTAPHGSYPLSLAPLNQFSGIPVQPYFNPLSFVYPPIPIDSLLHSHLSPSLHPSTIHNPILSSHYSESSASSTSPSRPPSSNSTLHPSARKSPNSRSKVSSNNPIDSLHAAIVQKAKEMNKGLDPENMYIECPICHKRIKRLYHFQRHMRIHSGEKSHKCEYCPYKSVRKDNLKSHMKTHEKSKHDSSKRMSARRDSPGQANFQLRPTYHQPSYDGKSVHDKSHLSPSMLVSPSNSLSPIPSGGLAPLLFPYGTGAFGGRSLTPDASYCKSLLDTKDRRQPYYRDHHNPRHNSQFPGSSTFNDCFAKSSSVLYNGYPGISPLLLGSQSLDDSLKENKTSPIRITELPSDESSESRQEQNNKRNYSKNSSDLRTFGSEVKSRVPTLPHHIDYKNTFKPIGKIGENDESFGKVPDLDSGLQLKKETSTCSRKRPDSDDQHDLIGEGTKRLKVNHIINKMSNTGENSEQILLNNANNSNNLKTKMINVSSQSTGVSNISSYRQHRPDFEGSSSCNYTFNVNESEMQKEQNSQDATSSAQDIYSTSTIIRNRSNSATEQQKSPLELDGGNLSKNGTHLPTNCVSDSDACRPKEKEFDQEPIEVKRFSHLASMLGFPSFSHLKTEKENVVDSKAKVIDDINEDKFTGDVPITNQPESDRNLQEKENSEMFGSSEPKHHLSFERIFTSSNSSSRASQIEQNPNLSASFSKEKELPEPYTTGVNADERRTSESHSSAMDAGTHYPLLPGYPQSNREFKCRLCEYIGVSNSSLQEHMATHKEDGLYKCQQCDYHGKNLSKLIEHIRIHTGERPFQCDQCDYAAKRKDNLAQHKSVRHDKNKYKAPTRLLKLPLLADTLDGKVSNRHSGQEDYQPLISTRFGAIDHNPLKEMKQEKQVPVHPLFSSDWMFGPYTYPPQSLLSYGNMASSLIFTHPHVTSSAMTTMPTLALDDKPQDNGFFARFSNCPTSNTPNRQNAGSNDGSYPKSLQQCAR